MFRSAYRVLATLLVLSFSIGWTASAQAQSSGEQPSLYPHSGVPGTRFTFIFAGFKSREKVAVWYNTPDGKVSDKGIENLDKATSQGRVSWAWTAPKDGSIGTYQMVAQGLSSGIQQTIAYQIGTIKPQPPTGNIEPKVARPGALLIFNASGFLINEDVNMWVNTPDGKVFEIALEQRRLNDGRVDASYQLPTNAQIGHWQLVIHGYESGVEQVLNFDVRS
ncbi:MAG: hypothetical protein SH847_22810 [Roseiflexaceae bacterium]|nr:hypothetical protein [Roseiflexaceae bacterium]